MLMLKLPFFMSPPAQSRGPGSGTATFISVPSSAVERSGHASIRSTNLPCQIGFDAACLERSREVWKRKPLVFHYSSQEVSTALNLTTKHPLPYYGKP